MPNINRREFLGTAVAGLALPQVLSLPSRPNIIWILADDLGYGDLSCYGRPDYKTPVIDSLADEGIRFTDNYANADVCTPTRVAYHTGRYQQRLQIGLQQPLGDGNTQIGLSPEHPTLPSLLKTNGYETCLVGKWHCGNAPQYHPLKHGYEEFFGIVGSSGDYFTHRNTAGSKDLFEGEKAVESDAYLTDLFTDRGIRFLRKARTRPFYLGMQYNAPHWPWQRPEDKEAALKADGRANAVGGTDEIFAAMMKSMDAGIGRLLQALRDTGQERSTLIIFTSDNGGERYSRNWPFSFRKGSCWEGGIRVPALARWSGVIPARKTTDQAAITIDWTATILATTGAKADPKFPLEGADLMGVCTAQRPVFERTLFWRNNQHDASRVGNWKYLHESNTEHLFNLATDPGEKTDLREKEPAVFARIKAGYEAWNAQMLPRPAAGARRGAATRGQQ